VTSAIRPARRLAWLGRACLVAAAAVTVAGCVSMPDNDPMGAISASPQSTTAGGDFIEPVPSGPTPNEAPAAIVNGFLAASASFPVHDTIAREYLVSAASKTWSPTWSVTVFNSSRVSQEPQAQPSKHGAARAVVDFSADVQSTFDGNGQFVSASTKQSETRTYQFHLVQVDGQWRIANPPQFRLLTGTQFTEFYQARDLYFVNPYLPGSSPLIPASVFVPQGTSTADLVTKLINALLPDEVGQPNSTWLQAAADTFPAGTTLSGVTLDNTTAVVSLHGPANASKTTLEQVSAQLTWTLASPRPGPPSAIQSVELVWDGQAFIPPEVICGSSQTRSPVQNQEIYSCYNPYPSQPSEFFFASNSQVWSRCGSEASAQRGQVGQVVSVFRSTGSSPPCSRGSVSTNSTAAPASVPPVKGGPASVLAVSPDGTDVAYYSPATKDVVIRLSASGGLRQVSVGPDVTALSWDRSHDLWIAQNGDVFMVPPTGAPIQATTDLQDVTALSIAPDGVRVALVEQSASGPEVELAAVAHGGPASPGQHGSPMETASINGPVQVGPDVAQPDTLTWYDADDLIVLAGSSTKATLSEVPVDGQNSVSSQPAPAGANAITAAGGMNALVAGLSDHQLAVSTGLEGPWQPLAVPGQNPAYPG
jgi:Lipoprotein LpqB beta-propeller domain/Sporulation and spore germination